MLLAALALLCGDLVAQTNRTITGKVTDDKGAPMIGVTVTAKGTSKRTLTDNSGSFSLQVPSTVKILQFNYVGFSIQEVSISGNSVNVSMTPEDKSLSEVVVVGYGTQKKKDVTGNLVTVKGREVANKPTQSFDQALAGRAAGVQITVPNGVVNNPPVFRIRGTNSISLSSYPLIVVDGVPTYTGDFSSTNAASNALSSINPNDIESIDIAKDAAATSIYGSRAANGVVFITTKKGKAGKAKVSYDGWVGWTSAYGLPDIMDAFQYTEFKNKAVANHPVQLAALGATPFKLTNDANGQPINTNWYDYAYRKAMSHSHTVNVSGGNESATYYFSAGYTDQQGIIQKNNFKRGNVLFNVDARVNKVVSMGGKIAFSNEKNEAATTSGSLSGEAFSTAGLGRLVLVNAPNVGAFKNDGTYNIGAQYVGPMSNVLNVSNPAASQVGFFNPKVLVDLNRSNSENNHMQGNIYFQLKPLSWITLKTVFGVDYINVDNDLFWNPFHGDGQSYNGYASANYGKYKTWVWTNTAQFDQTFKEKHSVSLLAGGEQQRRTSEGFGINRQALSDPAFNLIQAGFTNNFSTGMVRGENYLQSVFARLNYNFDKKYFLSGNIRQDEYSGLGIKKGTFWGASGGWEISQENFWRQANLDNLFNSFKLRGSYGKVGNIAGIGDFTPYSTFGSGVYGGNPTLSFSTVGNNQLKWETSTKSDVGVTATLLRNRLTVDVAYYKNNIDNMILGVPQAPSTGLGTLSENVGSMYNKGIELTIDANPVNKGDFTWNTSFNFSSNKNEVTALAPGLNEILTATSGLEAVNKTMVGYSVGYIFVVRTAGVDPASGRRIFVNKNGQQVLYQFYAPSGQFNYSNPDGTQYRVNGAAATINQAADGVMYANSVPKYYGGWSNTFRYKGFELDVLLTYQGGFSVYYGTNAGLRDQRFWNNSVDMLRAWTKAGDITDIPRSVYGDNVSNGSGIPIDANVFKGDFIKLRNASLAYNLPKSLLDKAKISTARVYVSGQNLAIFSKYPGPDPEVSSNGNSTISQGVDRNTVGNGRTITVGINIGF